MDLTLDTLLANPPQLTKLAPAVHGHKVSKETFLLEDEWMLHFYDYHGEITIGRHTFQLRPGSVSVAPAGMPVTFCYSGPSRHLYAHFRLPHDAPVPPEFWEPDSRIPTLRTAIENALYFRETDPRRACARLWDVLLGLVTIKHQPTHRSQDDQVIESAIGYFESAMSTRVRISEVARHARVSVNTLTRMFQRRFGVPPVVYLRRCRIQRAMELLRHSDLPVKAVACSVGFPDLHQFNKILRKETAHSPRAWRREHLPRIGLQGFDQRPDAQTAAGHAGSEIADSTES